MVIFVDNGLHALFSLYPYSRLVGEYMTAILVVRP